MQECELLSRCGFFGKHQDSHHLICKEFIKNYCIGRLQNTCKRKDYRIQHNQPPPDDMMPNGELVPQEEE